VPAEVEAHHGNKRGLSSPFNQDITFIQSKGKGFLYQKVFTGLNGRQCYVYVEPRRHTDSYRLNRRIRQKIPIVGVSIADVILVCRACQKPTINVGQGSDFNTGNMAQGREVPGVCHVSTADHANGY
jgi:hypothetical protein